MLKTSDYDARLEELKSFKVDLDPDPVSKGIFSLNEKLAQVQAFKDRVCALLVEAHQNVSEYEIIYESVKHQYESNLERLLVSDPEVQSLKSDRLRIASANVKLAELLIKLNNANLELLRAKNYLKCVQTIYDNLNSVNENLTQQIYVIQIG
ncbi:MAG: hypothetical protein NC925_05845 [Candidatus Omnitrophica bacterium]|nr:hypothetical protein [Candidatus Omnitrophota bacterium]